MVRRRKGLVQPSRITYIFKKPRTITPNMSTRNRRWVFTLHTPEAFEALQEALITWAKAHTKYCRFQAEIAPNTGQRHLQGWFILNSPKSLTAVKSNLRSVDDRLDTCHLEVAQGTVEDNEKYVSKTETRDLINEFSYTHGECPNPGM